MYVYNTNIIYKPKQWVYTGIEEIEAKGSIVDKHPVLAWLLYGF